MTLFSGDIITPIKDNMCNHQLIRQITKQAQHRTELLRTDPGTKVTGEFNIKDRILAPNAQNGFYCFHSFSWKKMH